jgi:serpin B
MRRFDIAGVLASAVIACGASATGSLQASAADQPTTGLAESYNAIGRQLAGELAKTPGNIVLSPVSIGMAMAMTFTGARGETAREMADVLKFTAPREEIDRANRDLLAALGAADAPPRAGDASAGSDTRPPAKLAIANALFVTAKNASLAQDYVSAIKDNYAAEMFAAAKLDDVNAWVRGKTAGKIETILKDLSPNSVAVLLNAIYFKAAWAEPFDKQQTRDEAFSISPDGTVPVPMMQRSGRYAWVAGDGFKAIVLPYAGQSTIGMIIAVPDDVGGLAAMSDRLDLQQQTRLLAQLGKQPAQPVALALPRFKAAYEGQLVPAFEQLGMHLPFDAFKADFSGMTGQPNSEGVISISQIVHKAVLEVTEEGTEATAATAVEIFERSMAKRETFRVDRPFLFFIADLADGAILFQGRIVDPR